MKAARRKISSRPKEAEVGQVSVVGGNSPGMSEPFHLSNACGKRSNRHSLVQTAFSNLNLSRAHLFGPCLQNQPYQSTFSPPGHA